MSHTCREPAVAGRFYPDDVNELKRFIASSYVPTPDGRVRALMVPHAGYVYSGATAGKGYSLLDPCKVERVLLIGPTHRHGFYGVSVPPCDSYRTPLGDCRIDTDLRDLLVEHDLFSSVGAAHRSEHCLEVQVPFLQTIRSDIRILPMLCGELNRDEIRRAAEILLPHWDETTAIVISSDFTHYGANYGFHPFPVDRAQEEMPKFDGKAIKCILNHNVQGFQDYVDRTGATICGRRAIAILLEMLDDDMDLELLEYTSSGEKMGDFSSSVGYAAIAVRAPIYCRADKDLMLATARNAIKSRLEGNIYTIPKDAPEKLYDQGCCFVTLRIDGSLRGCIGCLEPREGLLQNIASNAVSAAFSDPRFPALTVQEYDKLEYCISVLTPSRPVDSFEDIVIGKHGIVLRSQGRRAVYLPEVATDQGWDLQTTLEHLSMKAGLPMAAWKEASYDVFETVSFGDD